MWGTLKGSARRGCAQEGLLAEGCKSSAGDTERQCAHVQCTRRPEYILHVPCCAAASAHPLSKGACRRGSRGGLASPATAGLRVCSPMQLDMCQCVSEASPASDDSFGGVQTREP